MTQETEREAFDRWHKEQTWHMSPNPQDAQANGVIYAAWTAWQARARVGKAEVKTTPRTYYAWLIEQRDINGKPTWLKIDNFIHEQTDNAWEALHFGRRVDAEAYAAGNEDEVIYIIEHAFLAISAKLVEVGEAASKPVLNEDEAIEIASKAAWERDYPHGGSMVKTWADNSDRDRALYANEVTSIVRALLSKMGN